MRISRLIGAMACAGAIAATTPAVADDHFEEQFTFNVSAGWMYFDDDRQLSERRVFTYGGEFRLHPNWAAEASFSRGETKAKYGPADRQPFYDYRLDGLYYFTNDFHWQPYVALGIGEAKFRQTGETRFGTRNEVRANTGGGVRYVVSDLVSLRADVRGFWGFRDDTLDATASVGFGLNFTTR